MAMYSALDPADPTRYVGYSGSVVETDSPVPWHHIAIRVPEAWALLKNRGLDAQISRRKVAIIDTGYTKHSCFGGWSNDLDSCVLVSEGENYVESGLPIDPFEDQYPGHPVHGTRVASVIAATDGVAGVAKGAKLVPYRVTRSVMINDTTPLHKALYDAMSEGCEVANISLGCPCLPGRKNGKAVDKAYLEGLIVVAAAGNVTSEVTYPGRHYRTITAGGVTQKDDKWAPWSGGARGPRVDFCAPADCITRADWVLQNKNSLQDVLNEKQNLIWSDVFKGNGDGTSYAAAFISGIACLWITRWAGELKRYTGWQRVEAFRKVLGETCDVPDDWDSQKFGCGVVNAERALEAPLPDPDKLVCISNIAEDDLH